MKIGFLIHDLNAGGAERSTVSLANSFAEKGHEVKIITISGDESFYILREDVTRVKTGLDNIKSEASIKRITDLIKRMFVLRKTVKEQDLDVLIGMSFSMTWYTVFATIFTNIVSIGTERNNPYKYKATKLNTFLRKLFYYLADGFVFQTEKASRFFNPVLKNTDAIIPNAIFNEAVYKLNPPKKRVKVICSVGRLTEQKRFDVLLNAFGYISLKYPDYKLIIFGEGELRKALEKQVEDMGLTEKVILPGAIPDAVKLVNFTSAFVLSSDIEGMPNALMEAMAMGVPSIATRCDMGPEELIENNINGILVDVGSSEQIANALDRILSNKDFSEELSENGRKMLIDYSIDNISDLWLEYLKKICRQNRI